jgi:L-lactate dehydrogenase complex protein LldG
VDTAVTVGLGGHSGAGLAAGGRRSGAGRPPAIAGPAPRGPGPARGAGLTVQEALDLVKKHQGSLVTWLTGPTRTADIEKILVLGAQGPAELTIILYQPKPSGE